MSNSVRPQRWQPTRLPCPWDSPGKNTGVGCQVLLQCMTVKSQSEVAQSCLTPSDSMDCSIPGSSVHGIFQARVLEWGAIAFSVKKRKGWRKKSHWKERELVQIRSREMVTTIDSSQIRSLGLPLSYLEYLAPENKYGSRNLQGLFLILFADGHLIKSCSRAKKDNSNI